MPLMTPRSCAEVPTSSSISTSDPRSQAPSDSAVTRLRAPTFRSANASGIDPLRMIASEPSTIRFPPTTIVSGAKIPSIAPSIVWVLTGRPDIVGEDGEDELLWQPEKDTATKVTTIVEIPFFMTQPPMKDFLSRSEHMAMLTRFQLALRSQLFLLAHGSTLSSYHLHRA